MQYRFGNFELDARTYELRRHGAPLRVEPRVLDLLLFLIRNRDRVVSREELLDSIWKEKFIGEAALTRCVMEARKAIAVEGDEDPIRTVHRRGYRFVAPVTEESRAEAAPEPVPVPVSEPVPEPVPLPIAAPEPEPPRTRRFPVLGVLAAAGIALVLMAMVAFPRAKSVPAISSASMFRVSSELKVTRVTTSGKAVDAAISPDGKFIAYVVDNAGALSIRLRQVATGSDTELVAATDHRARKSLTFTPDGSYLGYLEQYEPGAWALYRVATLGGAPLHLVEPVEGSAWSKGKDFSFTPDGASVAFVRRLAPDRTALYVTHLGSRQERQLMVRSGALFRPVWSTDGKTLLCHWKLPGYSTEIRVLEVSLRSPAVQRELQASRSPLFVAQTMLPGGQQLIGVGGRSLSAAAFYLADYPSMKLVPITQGVGYWRSPSVTPDGRALVAVRVQQTYNLWTGTDGESGGQQLTFDVDSMEGIHGIAVTKKGEVVYTSRTNGENNHVWMASPDGRRLRQLTSGDEDEFWPAVSPSGDTIFYGQRQTAETRAMRIWKMDLSTGRSMQLTTGNWDMLPAVTPDGRSIIYTDGAAESPVIKRVGASGGASETIAPGILFAPAISSDGKYAAGFYARTMSDDRALVTMRLDDGKIVERFAVDSPPAKLCLRWAADGRGLIIVQTTDGIDNLWLYPLGGGKPRQLTTFRSLDIAAFNLMPDGKTYVFSRGRDESDVVMIADLLAR